VTTPLTVETLRSMPLPVAEGDKDDRGQVLVLGGSRRVPGAAWLAGVAALRTGAGKLQVATAAEVAVPLGVVLPEAMMLGLPADGAGECSRGSRDLYKACQQADAVLAGPGMAATAAVHGLVRRLYPRCRRVLVLDAGALIPDFGGEGEAEVVLTPHAGEMAALAGIAKEDVEQRPAEIAHAYAARVRAVVVLKGATTYIASPWGELWVHEGGCTGLGTSGSGDVLAGMLAAFAARGASARQAALWAVVVHALAGDRLTIAQGPVGFLAREIPAEIPGILVRLA
jgi:hydroxyethylthiazole kinase-like uncharacterized protein yjeF